MHIIRDIKQVKRSGSIQPSSVLCADCLKAMPYIPNKSVDLILTDLPFGLTSSPWDTMIPFEMLWKEYNRIIKDKGTIVLFGKQPFTAKLISSNLKMFKYEWIWDKGHASNYQRIKKQPGAVHENILVFYKKRGTYNFIKTVRGAPKDYRNNKKEINTEKGFRHFHSLEDQTRVLRTEKYPTSILQFNGQAKEVNNKNRLHVNQKPLDLIEYLIATYSNPGDLVLDSCAGVLTTAVAAQNLKRQFICIEINQDYFDLGVSRVQTNQSS